MGREGKGNMPAKNDAPLIPLVRQEMAPDGANRGECARGDLSDSRLQSNTVNVALSIRKKKDKDHSY